MDLTEREQQIMLDQEFLITKARVLAKVYNLLSQTRNALKASLASSNFSEKQIAIFKTDKISKGENYLGLPYQVLDFPAYFSQKDTFAFRTMFWWGNFFSSTIHLEGQFLDHYKPRILEAIESLSENEVFICVSDSPWHYHFNEDNYMPLTENEIPIIERGKFLKLSKKLDLADYKKLPEFSSKFLEQLLNILVVTQVAK